MAFFELVYLFFYFMTVQTLVRESQVVREAKEKQIVELKKLCEQSTDSLNNEWEKRVMNSALFFFFKSEDLCQ